MDTRSKEDLKDGKLIVPWRINSSAASVMHQRVIHLLTPEELKNFPNGTVVYSIFGEKKIVGTDYIDDDTRDGRLAYGTLVEDDAGKDGEK